MSRGQEALPMRALRPQGLMVQGLPRYVQPTESRGTTIVIWIVDSLPKCGPSETMCSVKPASAVSSVAPTREGMHFGTTSCRGSLRRSTRFQSRW